MSLKRAYTSDLNLQSKLLNYGVITCSNYKTNISKQLYDLENIG